MTNTNLLQAAEFNVQIKTEDDDLLMKRRLVLQL